LLLEFNSEHTKTDKLKSGLKVESTEDENSNDQFINLLPKRKLYRAKIFKEDENLIKNFKTKHHNEATLKNEKIHLKDSSVENGSSKE
jgi:hypothetical protein